MPEARFVTRLRTAAEDGVILAVKYGLLLLLVAVLLLDYLSVRQAAYYAAAAVAHASTPAAK